nr:ATP-binding protein [Deferrivibrio essentukiensis]
MSSGLAHELKNPAMTVLLLAQTLAKELDERYSKDTEYLIRETNKIVKIVNEFLEIAKPISIKKSDVKVSEIQKVLEDYIYINYSDKLELIFINNIKSDTIFTDGEKVIEILINLINNSFEAAATRVEIVFEDQDSYVLVGFRDNGFGIDEENIDKIFLPFYTTKKTGTGLGLFYIESIINALNGQINVSSNEYGTTFIIRLTKE